MRIKPVIRKLILREMRKKRLYVPELGERHLFCDWTREDDDGPPTIIDMKAYSDLLQMLPDKIVNSLEHARLERAGKAAMFKAGLGYEECVSSIIVDGSAIATSTTEAFLVPANLLPANYLQPGGLPGRTIKVVARGRYSTLAAGGGTLTFKIGAALTNVIPTTTWAVSGGMAMDTNAVTAAMWVIECGATVRSVGSGGTVFAMGDASVPSHLEATAAAKSLRFMGSAGANTPATAAVDMTVPQFLGFTGKWSVSNASYSIQAHRYMLEVLN